MAEPKRSTDPSPKVGDGEDARVSESKVTTGAPRSGATGALSGGCRGDEVPLTMGSVRAPERSFVARVLVPTLKERTTLVRRLALPIILTIIPLFWVLDASHRVSVMTLGRDQGIFQYIAWATSIGDVDYRDVRDVNGPLVHLIHRVFLML